MFLRFFIKKPSVFIQRLPASYTALIASPASNDFIMSMGNAVAIFWPIGDL